MDKSWAPGSLCHYVLWDLCFARVPICRWLCWWPKALLQNMVGMGYVESRRVFLLKVSIARSRSWWTCKMLWHSWTTSAPTVLECRMRSWSSRALVLEASICCFPANPNEGRKEEAGSGREGMVWEGAAPAWAVLTKKSDHAIWFCIVFVLECVQHVCVRKGTDGCWVGMNYKRQSVGSGFWKGFEGKEEKTPSFKNSVNIMKTNSSWYSSRVLGSDSSENKLRQFQILLFAYNHSFIYNLCFDFAYCMWTPYFDVSRPET